MARVEAKNAVLMRRATSPGSFDFRATPGRSWLLNDLGRLSLGRDRRIGEL